MDEDRPAHALYYDDDLVANLQLRWGAGFMSPAAGKSSREGLDFGCGVGGYDRLLVTEHGAAAVFGIDLGAAVVAEAQARAEAEALGDRLHYRVVEPGSIPFEDDRFGFVLSKDAIVEVPDRDKPDVLRELYRVTAPGGWVVLSDWFRGPDDHTNEMRAWATTGEEAYDMVTIEKAADWPRDAGYTRLAFEDRNAWYRSSARDETARLRGPLHPTYAARFGEKYAATAVENARLRSLLADQGQLRPGHVRARKPD